MRVFLTLNLLLGYLLVEAQNFQSYNFMMNDNTMNKADTILKMNYIPDVSKIFETIRNNINKNNVSYSSDTATRAAQMIRDSFRFVAIKSEILDSLEKAKNKTKENLKKIDILEAAWLKMNNLNPEQNTIMYADISELKRSMTEAYSEIIKISLELQKIMYTTGYKQKLNEIMIYEKNSFNENKFLEIKNKLNTDYINFKKSQNLKESGTATIPQISTINSKFNPSISLLGATEINKNGRYKLEFFIGNGSIDTASTATILIPELSRYGVQINGFNGLNKRVGFNSNLNYHEKKAFNIRDSSTFAFTRLQAKFGLEVLIFKDILSFYGNFNYILPISNTDKYREYFAPKKGDLSYWDLGVKLFLTPKGDLAKTNDVGLFIDLNFISTTNAVKVYHGNNDTFIPNMKFGLQKNFK